MAFWFKKKETADDFAKTLAEEDINSNILKEAGGFTVSGQDIPEDIKEDTGENYRRLLDREIAQSKREAVRDAEINWDDALPDESPIGKTREQIDEVEAAEQRRLKREREREQEKEDEEYEKELESIQDKERRRELADLRYEADREMYESRKKRYKSKKGEGGFADTAGKVLWMAGVGRINKSALGLYGVGKQSAKGNSLYLGNFRPMSGDNGLSALRQLTSPQSLNMPAPISAVRINKGKQVAPVGGMRLSVSAIEELSVSNSSIAKLRTPLAQASLMGNNAFATSPLAMQAVSMNIQGSKIAQMAKINMGIAQPFISQSNIDVKEIKKPKKRMSYKRTMNNLKRRRK